MFLTMVKNGANTVVGAKQTLKAIAQNKAEIIAFAEDAAEKIILPIEETCKENKIPYEKVGTMEELGKACGIKGGASVAVILKS